MGIKRNQAKEPQWNSYDYAKIDKENLFSDALWKRTINWDLLLEHVEQTESACQAINGYIYPSRLFTVHIDILEANMYILNDIFYYETGIPPKDVNKDMWFVQTTDCLKFWNMDWYQEMKGLYEGLSRIKIHLIRCLEQEPLSEIAKKVSEKSNYLRGFLITHQEPCVSHYKYGACSYAYNAYRMSRTNKNVLVDKIVNIVNILEDYRAVFDFFLNINKSAFSIIHFEYLATMFRQSRKGESYIKPWRRDFMDSRDSLIVKMEKDPELGPWVNRYTHLRDRFEAKTAVQLFCDDFFDVKNVDETFNTDNWIRLLTIASVLQEYDEQYDQPAMKPTARNTKAPSLFTEFIIDTPKCEAVLKRLHEIIDDKTPKACALTILAAVQKGFLRQPTYKALFAEFPEIGDRKNYQYYLGRRDNYQDDINSIAKGL